MIICLVYYHLTQGLTITAHLAPFSYHHYPFNIIAMASNCLIKYNILLS